jgi:hypothetical protein
LPWSPRLATVTDASLAGLRPPPGQHAGPFPVPGVRQLLGVFHRGPGFPALVELRPVEVVVGLVAGSGHVPPAGHRPDPVRAVPGPDRPAPGLGVASVVVNEEPEPLAAHRLTVPSAWRAGPAGPQPRTPPASRRSRAGPVEFPLGPLRPGPAGIGPGVAGPCLSGRRLTPRLLRTCYWPDHADFSLPWNTPPRHDHQRRGRGCRFGCALGKLRKPQECGQPRTGNGSFVYR